MTPNFSEMQLDALRELANIGSGTAGGALSQMLGKPVDISVPTAIALPLSDAVAHAGDPEDLRWGVVVPIVGDIRAHVLLLFPEQDAISLCGMFGVTPDSPDGQSALQEIGNILGTSYINVLAQMVGMALEPEPPMAVLDMLGSIISTVLLGRGEDVEMVLLMDSALEVEGEACSLSFLLLPEAGAVGELLGRLGL
jgi:chemotaxis protein CheC